MLASLFKQLQGVDQNLELVITTSQPVFRIGRLPYMPEMDPLDLMDLSSENDFDKSQNQPQTPTKPAKTLAQLIMSSPDLLTSQIVSKPSQKITAQAHKRKAIASPESTKIPDHQTPDEMLKQARHLLKQTLQKIVNNSAQLELENSIMALDQARKHASLKDLKQPTESFHSQNQQIQEDVQKQLNSFKSDISVKLNEILLAVTRQSTTQLTNFGAPTPFTAQTTKQIGQKPKTPAVVPTTGPFVLNPLHTDLKSTRKIVKATTNTQTATQKSSETLMKSTYADVVGNNNNVKTNNTWTTIQKKPKPEKPKPVSYRDRRLILTPKTKINAINPIVMRNKINNAIKTAKIDNLLVSTVALSQSGASMVFTTSEGTADDLLKHQKVWESLFDFTEVKKDEKWYKVIAHSVPTDVFDNNMALIKEEIELFNKDMKLATMPQWLTSEEARKNKMHASIILSFKTNQEVQRALRNRLIIAGTSVRTAVYQVSKPSDQCKKCQKFGHHYSSCKNKDICQFCAGNHNTRQHKCFMCPKVEAGTTCAHVVYKCSNCQENHQANSVECSVFKALQPISSNTDAMEEEL